MRAWVASFSPKREVHRRAESGAVHASQRIHRTTPRRGARLSIGTRVSALGWRSCPQVAGLVIDAVGWRLAYVGLAVAVLLVAFPPVAMFLREPPGFEARARRPQQPAVSAAAVLGVAAGEALRSWLFWELVIAFFLDVIAINGLVLRRGADAARRLLAQIRRAAAHAPLGDGLPEGIRPPARRLHGGGIHRPLRSARPADDARPRRLA